MHRYILRFDIGGLHLQHVEMLAQAYDVARVFDAARALAPVEIRYVRRAADADEGDIVAAEGNIGLGHRPVHDEFAGRRIERRLDKGTIDFNQQAAVVDAGAGLSKSCPDAG